MKTRNAEVKRKEESKLENLFDKLNKEVRLGKRKNRNDLFIRTANMRTRGDRGH